MNNTNFIKHLRYYNNTKSVFIIHPFNNNIAKYTTRYRYIFRLNNYFSLKPSPIYPAFCQYCFICC